ncbi:DNA-cytosine methyltransferase [Emticicia oligotrophica DSM 17448]|uniref:Cytosine-specific methyltransferase n=2 Tax=Emticicia TaxID=312278 RepID=A0ABN4ARV0_EMTOG|nr:DNA (cytosine-5-)-methyltransferase [Emticicia oligotrophica]AFK04775.1 DNA-cytosine methyltransferase [Emticicia oligotrophica DSM 17448]
MYVCGLGWFIYICGGKAKFRCDVMIKVESKILSDYKFIDLFAGIGGFHIALSSFGASCVFASEWDKYAADSYEANFNQRPVGDITQINEIDIPKHDILCAGFPCQSFSISGKQMGFEDIRGSLFFDIVRIINFHKPKVVFLENVKNLVNHDEGRTLKVVIYTLESVGYKVFTKILNSSNFGLPQNRERIYIVAFLTNIDSNGFSFPKPTNEPTSVEEILETNPVDVKFIERDDIQFYKTYLFQDTLFGKTKINKPLQIGKVNKGGQGERIYDIRGHAITLSAHGGGIGAKTGLYFINGKIRRLTTRECARVQGFPEDFKITPNTSQAYKQFGNSVSINVLQRIMIEVQKILLKNEQRTIKRFTNSKEWVS